MTRQILVGTALVSIGIGTMIVIVRPFTHAETFDRGLIESRWPPALPKADRMAFAPVNIFDPTPERLPPDPVEQSLQRREFDEAVERNAKKYFADARPREFCARHGMRRKYYHRHHRLVWRCI